MNNTFSKLDLVTREEFEIQKQVLQHTRAKLDLIEKQLDELLNHDNSHHSNNNNNNINNTAVNLHSSQHDAVSLQKEEV
jgi:BMFP domain-containing protein YqiC